MHYIPIKTRIFRPPQDDMFELLDTHVIDHLVKGDVLLVSSKIVSIHEGRCILIDEVSDREKLVEEEADAYFRSEHGGVPGISLKNNTLIGSAGIDTSNSDGYYVLWPRNAYRSAREIAMYLKKKTGIRELGVIVVDSHSVPLRWGVIGISIGFFGIEPVVDHTGASDIFGRTFRYSKSNIVDSLAASGVLAMGETDELTPCCIVRDIFYLRFSSSATDAQLLVPPQQDMYYPVMKKIYDQLR